MKRMKLFIGLVLLVAASPVFAAPLTFLLGDHPDGALYDGATNPYGIRVDASNSIFSVGGNLPGGVGGPVTLTFDPMNLAAGAVVSGTVVEVSDGSIWTLMYTLSGLSAAGSGGFVATMGSGTLTEMGGAGLIALTGHSNGSEVFEFDNDGHRLPGDPGSGWVGRGWLEPADSTNDFLVTGTVVPVPAAIWLFVPALLGLAGLRRKPE